MVFFNDEEEKKRRAGPFPTNTAPQFGVSPVSNQQPFQINAAQAAQTPQQSFQGLVSSPEQQQSTGLFDPTVGGRPSPLIAELQKEQDAARRRAQSQVKQGFTQAGFGTSTFMPQAAGQAGIAAEQPFMQQIAQTRQQQEQEQYNRNQRQLDLTLGGFLGEQPGFAESLYGPGAELQTEDELAMQRAAQAAGLSEEDYTAMRQAMGQGQFDAVMANPGAFIDDPEAAKRFELQLALLQINAQREAAGLRPYQAAEFEGLFAQTGGGSQTGGGQTEEELAVETVKPPVPLTPVQREEQGWLPDAEGRNLSADNGISENVTINLINNGKITRDATPEYNLREAEVLNERGDISPFQYERLKFALNNEIARREGLPVTPETFR